MEEFQQFLEQFEQIDRSGLIVQAGILILWIAVILFLSWLARKGITRSVKDNTMRYRGRKIVRLVSYVLILILVLVTFTGHAQYFPLAIGLISAGLAFALQEVILSVAGWVAIFAAKTYSPGDRIELDNVKGDVIDISITRTTLMEIGAWVSGDNYSGRIVQISNGFVFKKSVFNYSTDFPFVWDEIKIPVRYGSDMEAATRIISETADNQLTDYADYAEQHWKSMVKKYLIEDAQVRPMITIKLNDNWIEFNLRYVVDFKKRLGTKHNLYTSIYEKINATDGVVLLASATYEVTAVPEITVKMRPAHQLGD